VHVGGTSTRQSSLPLYREQLRGHLRFLAKHRGPAAAEQARRYLTWILRTRILIASRAQRPDYRCAVDWLASRPAAVLLQERVSAT
jgi:hypothetical protein